jgi:hypothetical protein
MLSLTQMNPKNLLKKGQNYGYSLMYLFGTTILNRFADISVNLT